MSDNHKFPRPLHIDFEKGLLQEDESWNVSQLPKEETLCWDLCQGFELCVPALIVSQVVKAFLIDMKVSEGKN